MVILRGLVRDAQGSTDTANETLSGAIIVQGASGDTAFGVCYTSSNGTFYTSAINLDVVTCIVGRRQTSEFSIEDFATEYDPAGVISGALTANGDTTTIPGNTIITDAHQVFQANSLVGRILEMRSGVDDGKTGVIEANTVNTVTVGGTSGGGGEVAYTMALRTPTTTSAVTYARMVTLHSGGIVIAGGEVWGAGIYNPTVWYSSNGGSGWITTTTSAEYAVGDGFNMRAMTSYYNDSTDTIIAVGAKGYDGALFKSTDWGATWVEIDPITFEEPDMAKIGMVTLATGNVLMVAYGDRYWD